MIAYFLVVVVHEFSFWFGWMFSVPCSICRLSVVAQILYLLRPTSSIAWRIDVSSSKIWFQSSALSLLMLVVQFSHINSFIHLVGRSVGRLVDVYIVYAWVSLILLLCIFGLVFFLFAHNFWQKRPFFSLFTSHLFILSIWKRIFRMCAMHTRITKPKLAHTSILWPM